MKTCVVIPCSSKKMYDVAMAKDMYSGSTFCSMREWAERSGHDWFIASTFYGPLHPSALIARYDLLLDRHTGDYSKDTPVATREHKAVLHQMFHEILEPYDRRIYLCGESYLKLMPTGETPLKGLRGFGYIRPWLRIELEKQNGNPR